MFWFNGEFKKENTISLEITEPGLIYGATLFTTLRVYQQSLDHPLTQWKSHCQRLESSLKAFDWNLPDWQQLYQEAAFLANHYPVLRLVIFPDGKEWITGRFLPPDLAQSQQKGIKGWVAVKEVKSQKLEVRSDFSKNNLRVDSKTVEPIKWDFSDNYFDNYLFKRSLANHKTGNYLGAFLALQRAKQLGFREAILVDNKGNWLETSTGNLWGYKKGIWYTPNVGEDILAGIGREQILSWLNYQQIPVKQSIWNPELIETLEVIAYSNSVVEIIPFSAIKIGDKQLKFNPLNPNLKQLKDYYN
ncbi:MAG TPA: 4-amino-4-deoxychorismate lyase [Cyanothece sp. UBA12306]|nr:4-amino-4-deoxychorismate lyase [Cyanothece sp. UBA12306]